MSIEFAWFLPVQIVFCANAIAHGAYATRLNHRYGGEHNLGNSILTVLLWITAGILYPFYFHLNSPEVYFFKFLSVFFICIFTPCMIFMTLGYQYFHVIRQDADIKQKRNINRCLEQFELQTKRKGNTSPHYLKNDIYRKTLHIFPAAVILLLWVFAVYIWEGMWHADLFWGISGRQFGTFLIITAGYSGVLVFAALDYVRLSYIFERRNLFHFLPNNVLDLLTKSMKRNEIFEFTKSAAMVLAFTPIFFFSFGIFIAAALIATIADGAASIFGLKFGKINFPKGTTKTIVGYSAGSISSYLIGLVSLIIFLPTLNFIKVNLIAGTGVVAFLIVDLANLNIDDNILNPLISGTLMALIYYFL